MFGWPALTLRKSKHLLYNCYRSFIRKKDQLSPPIQEELLSSMKGIQQAIQSKERKSASDQVRALKKRMKAVMPQGRRAGLLEMLGALVVALMIAVVVRQTCFEPMTIPTGSMRPTLREQDMLIVGKTHFGINVPLIAQHLYFDPDLVERGKIIVWTGHDVDLPNTDTLYFWLLPTKKPYVKRMMGKPGDTLYFYGGQVWAIDKNDQPIPELLELNLEHIPFQQFKGRTSLVQENDRATFYFRHFNQPVGRLHYQQGKEPVAEVYDGKTWVKEAAGSYAATFGIKNYAMGRLVTREQIQERAGRVPSQLVDAPLYLELRHQATLASPPPSLIDTHHGTILAMNPHVTWLPMQKEHLNALFQGMYTARFVVEKGLARSYSAMNSGKATAGVRLADVPDGTYELYHGKGYELKIRGRRVELSSDHPLLNQSPERIALLYNQGISLSPEQAASNQMISCYPHRYVYFRDGALYTMGVPIMSADDPILLAFLMQEKLRASNASNRYPYQPFEDHKPPLLADGSWDIERIKQFGLKLPEKFYLMLGDNHAMSGDSRYCGPVSEDNLVGAPSFLLYPWGERGPGEIGPYYPWFTIPRMIMWTLLLIGVGIWWLVNKQRHAAMEKDLC